MRSLPELVRFWVTLDETVDRRTYLVHGLVLGCLKYASDTLLVWIGTGAWWSPWSYLSSAPVLLASRFAEAEPFLAPVFVAWTLPFLWVGVTMTMRRAIDAGVSAWVALLFFVPLVSYLTIAVLCAMPTGRPHVRSPVERVPPAEGRRLPAALLSIAVGAALGLGMMVFCVRYLTTYGLALFMGTPFVTGAVTGFLLCQAYPATRRETLEVVTMMSLLTAGAAFALGTEGVVCLLMLMPIGLVLALLGGVVGRWIATYQPRSFHGAGLAMLLLPVASALEEAPGESIRAVRTEIEISAPPDVVWRHVVEFPPLDDPDELLFRWGVAYPIRAEIVGEGVGAVRYCVFSTGAFVEPITVWEPGRRLAFDVAESPAPLRELTPYEIDPPHLAGYLAPVRGEFLLEALEGGRTRLVGTTWYEQRLQPEGYWAVFSDRIIGAIHARVLEHIRQEAERDD